MSRKNNIYPNKEGCPVEFTLDVIGGKWKGILFYHMIDGKKRFNEFRKICPSITQRMLTLQLRELEADGIVHREVYHQVPPKVEYSLTEFGRTLEPIVLQMKEWGDANREALEARRSNSLLKEQQK
ncbi:MULTISPECIES: winged helix-turn-helix transcriptional regulator [Bacillus]|jgi:DNA-binding HxlR family transcriptional regulator|uniref:Transcriptional regulator (Cys-activated by oxidative stress) n=1 Tax=Bacillus mojavensis TaxID=72360 RepID=A0AAP3FXN9_BACMO|nr:MULTISPECIES: winged helix-turn-helix transcriptional regulator [Bacillus]MCC2929836.1 winged helix-turn-helix transcriptional regulator [Bacillus sp. LBG-1-113]MCY8105873.1 winged helix-turn-helix transcriptional regulator [Bacillus mojavensis]MCY8482216.1 winged helix-turn-helix transcriptional regulator [Bacillus mojavensis]MCY8508660.1 winged helix-turn-helix transcriptional regulator [Bacillus mojavensis]MCY9189171.1 winged helix-turn-helix transcriptional regulator [Bacillus mojavensi